MPERYWVAMRGLQVGPGEDDGIAAESAEAAAKLSETERCDRPVEEVLVIDRDMRDLAKLLQRTEEESLVLRVEGGLLMAYQSWAKMPLDCVDDGIRYADVGDLRELEEA